MIDFVKYALSIKRIVFNRYKIKIVLRKKRVLFWLVYGRFIVIDSASILGLGLLVNIFYICFIVPIGQRVV